SPTVNGPLRMHSPPASVPEHPNPMSLARRSSDSPTTSAPSPFNPSNIPCAVLREPHSTSPTYYHG
ncbi:MAG: hypothetical protein Q9183_007385, partial [Haloplaca sp. 2 TL-2023]